MFGNIQVNLIFLSLNRSLVNFFVSLQQKKVRNMTSVTIQIEESMSAKLKMMADKIGLGIDSYIINILRRAVRSETSDVDAIVKSMQLQHGNVVPAEENGKGAVADFKYPA